MFKRFKYCPNMACFITLVAMIALAGCTADAYGQMPPTLSPIPTQTLAPTPGLLQQAEEALNQYYSYLLAGKYDKAASLLSISAGLDRNAVKQMWVDLHNHGWRLTNYEVLQTQLFDDSRIIFRMLIFQAGMEPVQYESSCVMRLEEDGHWYYAAGILDHLTLRSGAKTISAVTVLPGLLERSVDAITIWLNIENSSNQPVIWGSSEAECGILYFGDEPIGTSCPSQVRVEPGNSVNTPIVFAVDAFERPRNMFPTRMNIMSMQWDADEDGFPDSTSESWEYHFQLLYIEP